MNAQDTLLDLNEKFQRGFVRHYIDTVLQTVEDCVSLARRR